MRDLREFIEKINRKMEFTGELRFDEPMSLHTTFKVGGPVDLWIRPGTKEFPVYVAALLGAAQTEGIPVFILGGGANLVVSDQGIPGIALDTGGWTGCDFKTQESGTCEMIILSGTPIDAAVEAAAEHGWSGLEFLAGMPGSIGGAIWMNARCYEKSMSDVLAETEALNEQMNRILIPVEPEAFGYKKSPFQSRKMLILSARCLVKKRDKTEIQAEMKNHRQDREQKGHYRFPSAGSAFKNNRDFGKPTGKLIDELGLRGLSWGKAQVAPWHGNLIINTGNATAADIRALVEEITCRVKIRLGLDLEPEILFVGDQKVSNGESVSINSEIA
ncbi:MAG: UDP-N-acetylmuramate dehydrogenase [Treponema sp.]|jgi:UDP-N-acetylmuramate dehydrogenase|nr:UDP-N-acetylmuramate dehydrogenase [Treponema sp.]